MNYGIKGTDTCIPIAGDSRSYVSVHDEQIRLGILVVFMQGLQPFRTSLDRDFLFFLFYL